MTTNTTTNDTRRAIKQYHVGVVLKFLRRACKWHAAVDAYIAGGRTGCINAHTRYSKDAKCKAYSSAHALAYFYSAPQADSLHGLRAVLVWAGVKNLPTVPASIPAGRPEVDGVPLAEPLGADCD